MKKSVLGLALLGMVASTSAFAYPVSLAASYDVSAGAASIATSASSIVYYGIAASSQGGVINFSNNGALGTPSFTYVLWDDSDNTLDLTADISYPAGVLTSGFLNAGQSTSLYLLPNKVYALQLFGNATAISAVAAVPVPAAAWLFGSGLLGLVGLRRRQQAA